MASGVYTNFINQSLQKGVNLLTDTLKYALLTSAYTPNLDTDTIWTGGINANEVTGTGYTAGGVTVASPALTQVAAASWAAWVASTAYAIGQVVRPATSNGFLYMCVAGGTSGSVAPTWGTTQGETTTDNTVVWLNIGTAAIKFTIAAPSCANSTITARYGVLYDTTANASGLLVCLDDFGSNVASTNGTFTVTPDGNSGLMVAYRQQ